MHDCRNLLFADILSSQGFTQQLLLLLHRTLSRIYSISSSTTVAMIPAKWTKTQQRPPLLLPLQQYHYSRSHTIPFPSLFLIPHLIKKFCLSRARTHARILLSRFSVWRRGEFLDFRSLSGFVFFLKGSSEIGLAWQLLKLIRFVSFWRWVWISPFLSSRFCTLAYAAATEVVCHCWVKIFS
jgi:hypothetical protein